MFALAAFVSASAAAQPSGDYDLFESDPVRPLALSADGRALFAINTPDARLEVFSTGPVAAERIASRPTGAQHSEKIPLRM